jgi:serine O-acetyltransferase
MIIEVKKKKLKELLCKQLNNFFFLTKKEKDILEKTIPIVLYKLKNCISASNNIYYKKNNIPYFNPYNSAHYSIFLYHFSNSIFKIYGNEYKNLASKIYYLNKCLNGLDVFYEVNLPKVFFLDHPVGTVLGRAQYGENFRFTQNCTVGNNKGRYPVIGKNVTMLAGSMILGNSKIGNYSVLAARSYVIDTNIPPFSVVFGSSPKLIIKKIKKINIVGDYL